MTHGSLFSGVGGFDLAAEWAGFENLFHCEWNPFCHKVLKHHFLNSESYEDITKTDFTKWRGKIDVLTGGFPCQPFSVAGSRKGAEDDRYLWPQMLRAIEEIRPTWVIGENVAGILTMVLPGEDVEVGGYTDVTGEGYKEVEARQLYVVERICQDFERIGYSVQPVIIPACAVGAPHRRDRIWFIANTNCDRCRKWKDKQIKISECKGTHDNFINGKNGIASDTNNKLLQSRYNKEQEKWERKDIRIESYDFKDCWTKFPTQPPVCNRNDGISIGLDDISFSKWRQESIKAMGNAIVPQVAYEIFKHIKQISYETTHHPNQRD